MEKKIRDKKSYEIVWEVLPWIFMVCGMIVTSVLVATKGTRMLSSDFAAEYTLVRHLNEEHTIVSRTWCYSSWIKIFDAQIIRKMVFAIVGYDNWMKVRIISNLIMMVILSASYIYTAAAAGFKKFGVWTAAVLSWPFGVWYLLDVLFSGGYFIYLINYILTIGLLIKLSSPEDHDKGKARLIIRIAALGFLGFTSGLDGLRGLMVCYTPLVIGSVLLTVISDATGFEEKDRVKNFRFAGFSVFVFACSGFGYLINKFILPRWFIFSSNYGNNPKWIELDPGKILATYSDFLQLLGYRSGVHIMSLMGVLNFLAIILAAMYVISLIRLCVRFKELSFANRIITVYNLTFGVFLAVIYMVSDWAYNESYWVPLLPFVFIAIQAEYDTDPLLRRDSLFGTKCISAMFIISVIGVSLSTYLSPYTWAINNSDDRINGVSRWVAESGYESGYATFWNSAILEELSAGKVRMYSINNVTENARPYYWLQVSEVPVDETAGRSFVLIGHDEFNNILSEAQKQYILDNYVYDDGIYIVVDITTLNDYLEIMTQLM